MPFNASWPYYEMFNILATNGTAYVESRECFDFVFGSLRFLNANGASLNGTLNRNVVAVYAKSAPVLANYDGDANARAQIIQFYELLDLKWSKVGSFLELLKLLWEVASLKLYVQHQGTDYYEFPLHWPVLDVSFVAQSIQ